MHTNSLFFLFDKLNDEILKISLIEGFHFQKETEKGKETENEEAWEEVKKGGKKNGTSEQGRTV